MTTRTLLTVAFLSIAAAISIAPRHALAQESPPPAIQEKVDAIKKAFQESQAKLRGFQWIQTTTVAINGEVKKTKTAQCYYGAEGTLVKVPLSESPPEGDDHERGLRGRIKEEEKKHLKEYMRNAEDLLKQYLPPNPALIQQAKDAGNASIRIIEPGVLAALDIHNYLNQGDLLSFEFNLADNRIVGISVVATMGQNQDPVTVNIIMGAFPDGTQYMAQTVLSAPAKNLVVTIDNAGYTPLNPALP